jgi:hypothetical protein
MLMPTRGMTDVSVPLKRMSAGETFHNALPNPTYYAAALPPPQAVGVQQTADNRLWE